VTNRIGFIGIGVMGRHMARNLARGGFQVAAYDVRREALDGLAEANLRISPSIADASEDADVVVTMLPDTPQAQEVLLGRGGVSSHPPHGRLVIDMSTISASATQAMAATLKSRGIALLDAPVSGGPIGAEKAALSIMVGGEAEPYARALPVLQAMGKTIVHCGASGAGQTVKMCNQLVVAINLMGVCEALALGREAGLDLAKLREVLMAGAAGSWMMQNLAPQILAKKPDAGFRIDLMLKDLRLVNEAAFELGVPLPGTALATQLYLEARAHGEGGNGNQALYRVYDRLASQDGAAS
jgi:2-hydroxy-3-oxopropionate reductase